MLEFAIESDHSGTSLIPCIKLDIICTGDPCETIKYFLSLSKPDKNDSILQRKSSKFSLAGNLPSHSDGQSNSKSRLGTSKKSMS